MIAAGERSVPKTGSARALLGIAAAIRATVPAPRFLHAHVAGLAVKFLQGVDHFIKLDDVTGTEDLRAAQASIRRQRRQMPMTTGLPAFRRSSGWRPG